MQVMSQGFGFSQEWELLHGLKNWENSTFASRLANSREKDSKMSWREDGDNYEEAG